jgi:hypothetical protein
MIVDDGDGRLLAVSKPLVRERGPVALAVVADVAACSPADPRSSTLGIAMDVTTRRNGSGMVRGAPPNAAHYRVSRW